MIKSQFEKEFNKWYKRELGIDFEEFKKKSRVPIQSELTFNEIENFSGKDVLGYNSLGEIHLIYTGVDYDERSKLRKIIDALMKTFFPNEMMYIYLVNFEDEDNQEYITWRELKNMKSYWKREEFHFYLPIFMREAMKRYDNPFDINFEENFEDKDDMK
jgi:hypothetical protein